MIARFIIIIIFNIIFSNAAIGRGTPKKVDKRWTELQSKDSLIIYSRSCSGCLRGTEKTVLFIYKKNRDYIFEYFSWDIQTVKINKHITSRRKSKYLSQIYRFINENSEELRKYDGYSDLSGQTLSERMNDTARPGIYYPHWISHGPSVHYTVKFGEYKIYTGTSYIPDIKFHMENFPTIGTLLLLLNIVYFEDDKLSLFK